MESEKLLNQYTEVRECEYKDRRYRARDNGAICRLPKEGGRPSKLDNIWTFGTKNPHNGYMVFTGDVRVHQVVCTAFHGPAPVPYMVVDHIDTNRCNNRPENLRWLTRLENALNNPATRKKIIYYYGSVDAFIENPSILRIKALPPDIDWMRTVTKEEANNCRRNIERWAQEDSPKQVTSSGKGIGDYIFSDEEMAEAAEWNKGNPNSGYKPYAVQKAEIEEANRRWYEAQYGLKDSLTPCAKQLNWKTPTEFLLCPTEGQERTLQTYLDNLVVGKPFSRSQYKDGDAVFKVGFNEADNTIVVLTHNQKVDDAGHGKSWFVCRISLRDSAYVHESLGSFFDPNGGEREFTEAMGEEWTGGEVFDDYC